MKRLLRSVTPIILCLVSFASRAGYITATAAGGHWTATTTWVGGIVPGPTDIAIIPAGSTVLVDAGDLEIPDPIGGAFDGFNNPASIIVYGTFNLADANYYPLFLRPVNIYIPSGGKMADLTINDAYLMFETSHIYVYSGGTYTAPVDGSYVYDAAGYPPGGDFNLYPFNPGNTSGPFTLTVALDQPTFANTTPPALPQVPVNSVAYPGDNQNFATPQYINFYVTWTSNNIPLTVTGSPYIDLTLGNKTVKAVYIGTDGVSSTAYFAYQVQPGDYAAPGHLTLGNVIHLNGGNITLNDGLSVSTDLSAPASPLPVPTHITVASPAPPIVSTPTATNITTAGAKLNAFVDDSGGATAVTFRYGTDPTMTSATTVAATPATIAAGTGNTAVTTTLTGLANSTLYYYQVVAQNSAATVPSNIQTFHTAPVVYFISYPADGTYGAGQILHFYVSWTPGEGPFTVTGTPTIDLTIGHKKVTVTANGADPTASTVYFIYTVQPGDYATGTLQLGPVIHLNGGAILDQYGDQVDTSLTNPIIPTSPTPGNVNVIAPAPPIASNAPADLITSTGATVYGYVDDSAANTAVTFVYGTDPALSGGTSTVPGIIPTIAAGTGNTLDSAILTGLTPSTTYYYQVVAVNSQGTATGTPILHFTTAPDAAPVVTTTGGTTTFYAIGSGSVPVAVDGGVTATDVDNTTLASATVSITSGYSPGDLLAFTPGSGMSGVYSAGTLTLTSSPSATLAQWNTALQSVKFTNSASNPVLGNRVVQFIVNDGILNSGPATKTVAVVQGLAFTGGASQSVSLCENSGVQDISSLLAVSDLNPSQTLTYGIVSAPANGSLGGFSPGTFTSNGGTMTPSGLTYTPTAGYSGTDAFTISVTNGTLTAQIVINVTINAQPAAPAITGASSVCSGSTITLAGNPTGGAWTTGNSAVATVDASGVVTGVAQGNTNIVYTVTNGFGCTNNATSPVAVNPVPATPGAIAGSAAVHNEQTGVAYSVTNDPTVTYTWSYTPPAGVTINGTGNAVTLDFGPTAASGTLSVVAVSNCSISSAASTLPITVSAPAITVSPSTLTAATVGAAYTASITASNGSTPYTFAVTAGSLPAGLSLSSGGFLSGTPTAGGSFNFTVTTTDTYGFPGSQSYTLTVNPAIITLTPTLPAATVGVVYNQSVTATGGTSPYTYAVTSGSLPAGLTLASDGTLSGTPTAGGSFTFAVTATDASTGTGPYTGTQSYSFTVNPAGITLTPTLPAAAVGVAYSQSVTATGGTSPYTYAVTSGSLPAGLTLASDGTLSGTPTAGGSFTFTITATDASTGSGPYTGSQSYTLTVNAASVVVAPATLLAATVGVAYSQSISATGGTSPYTYAVTSGSLPAGLTLASDGTLSGTPTAGGSFTFTITATDASTGSGPYTGSQSYTLTVNAASVVVAPATLPAATVGVAYSQSISATGGTSPYTYAVTSGSLPAGLTLASDGTLSGTPTAGGSFTFTITATDASTGSGPYTGSQSYTLTVNAASVVVAPATLPAATVGVAYSQSISATGGTSPYTYAVTSGSLPVGLTLASDGTLSGTPTAGGSFTFAVTATDASTGTGPYTGTQSYSFTVNPAGITLTPTLPAAAVGVAYSQSVTATDGTSPYTYTVTSGSLPAGMTLASDGTLSGTPTAGGSFTFTITATDASTGTGPYTGSQSYTLVVNAPAISLTPTTLPNATIAASYTASVSATGGTSPYTYAITAGNLPAGLTLASDGTLSGTPTAGGSFTFTITATDASTGTGPYTGSQAYTLVVNAPVISLAPTTLPNAMIAASYNASIGATGGTSPYTYTVTSGSLPAGLTLASDGTISGTPTAGGSFTFTVTATDASTGAGPYTGSQSYTLTVNAPAGISVAPATLPAGSYGQVYAGATIAASGGTSPYTYAVTSGSLPPGMTLASDGSLSGTPTLVGDYTFTVTATDASTGAGPYTGSAAYTVHIAPATLTITASDQSMTYGGTVPALTVTYSGFINGDNSASLTTQPTITTTATSASGVGQYPITANGAVDPNYNIVYVNGTLTINPASLLVTAAPVTRYFNTPNPPLTYTFSGFVNGDDASVLTSQPSISTTAVQTSPPGQYPITLSGGTAANYTLLYQDAVLTVVQSLNNVITFNPLPVHTYGDPDFLISATANSGLAVRFVSQDTTIATVYQDGSGNWMVHIVAAGQVTISAFQDGDGMYAPAPEVDQSLQINKASQTITFAALPADAVTGQTLTLSASSSAGLPVSFTLSDPTLGALSGNQLQITGTGTLTVTANQPGNNDYLPAPPVSYTINIFNSAGFHSGIGVFPNPAHGTIHIRFTSDYLITKYIIFGINGQVVRSETDVSTNSNDLQVDVGTLQPGYYLVRVVCIRNNEIVYPVFKVLIY